MSLKSKDDQANDIRNAAVPDAKNEPSLNGDGNNSTSAAGIFKPEPAVQAPIQKRKLAKDRVSSNERGSYNNIKPASAPTYSPPPLRLTDRGQLPRRITMGELCFMIEKHRSVVNRWLKAGKFLEPYQWPGGGLFWYEDELLEYLRNLPRRP